LDVAEDEQDTPGVEVSAGGVVVRRATTGLEVALAEQDDRNTGERTVRLPKGHLDPGESAEEAALREVEEEVGLTARIAAPLGEVAYQYFEESRAVLVSKRVHFFLMSWQSGHGHAADGEMARVYWAPLQDAADRLSYESESGVVERARALLESDHPPAL
jgi:8-oxo-dGTP pyrophosphatase MutT (NUDIX family)